MTAQASAASARLPDQADRDRFRSQLETNFSVVAPAGVGKTTAIIERIVRIAETDVHREHKILPKLVLVTYTKKAAAEMRDRARQRLMDGGADMVERLAGFNAAFFGTLHSFCLELLRRKGFAMGLPPGLDLVEDDELLWREFLRAQSSLLEGLPTEAREVFARYADIRNLADLARRLPPDTLAPLPGPPPVLDFGPLQGFTPSKRNEEAVAEAKARLHEWIAQEAAGEGWLDLPECKRGGKDYQVQWKASFAPLRDWLAQAAMAAAADLARRGRDFRLAKGMLRYDDMIDLARQLMNDPVAGDRVRREGYTIILDEAQDTDPAQFDVLLEVVREPGAGGSWREGTFPAPGRFCMVGDPQQSIYSDRADIKTYLDVHRRLVESPGGEEAAFTVTMRCDDAVVGWVNRTMPHALDAGEGQVKFVTLVARPSAGTGSVLRYPLELSGHDGGKRKADITERESAAVAEFLAGLSPQALGVRDWSEVALLCPRRKYLDSLTSALEKAGFRVQNHSRRDLFRDDPAYAWASAVLTVLAEPENAFEVAGVLRNVFALSDDAIARYVNQHRIYGNPHPLSLTREPMGEGGVRDALAMLKALRRELLPLPLREAFAMMLKRLELAERLASLPGGNPGGLAVLAHQATQAEEAGEDLSSWAAVLRRRGNASSGESDPEAGSIQLFTCHKSKGLEWPVVVLPFLFASIAKHRVSYPMVLKAADGSPCLAWDKDHPRCAEKKAEDLRNRQALQRLLYVAMTRPRRKLVLIDDQELFVDGKDAFASYLGLVDDGANRAAWKALPRFEAEAGDDVAMPAAAETGSVQPAGPLSFPEELAYPRRVLPSSLAQHKGQPAHERDERDLRAEPEYPELAQPRGDGAEYGNWWHETVETLPWSEAKSAWQAHFDNALGQCPYPERGREEAARFLQSELAARLAQAVWVRTEVPLLWRTPENIVYDGSIDLLARLNRETWLVVDWKTDSVQNDPATELLDAYGGQLRAYQEAIAAQVSGSCQALLYSTRRGVVVDG